MVKDVRHLCDKVEVNALCDGCALGKRDMGLVEMLPFQTVGSGITKVSFLGNCESSRIEPVVIALAAGNIVRISDQVRESSKGSGI